MLNKLRKFVWFPRRWHVKKICLAWIPAMTSSDNLPASRATCEQASVHIIPQRKHTLLCTVHVADAWLPLLLWLRDTLRSFSPCGTLLHLFHNLKPKPYSVDLNGLPSWPFAVPTRQGTCSCALYMLTVGNCHSRAVKACSVTVLWPTKSRG